MPALLLSVHRARPRRAHREAPRASDRGKRGPSECLTPEQALWREAPGEWNVVEIVGHLADTERVFEYRALHIARADAARWTNVEFGDYAKAANFQERPLGDVVAEYAAVRAAFVALLRGLDAAAWERRAPADWTLRSVRATAYAMAGHELHHLASIRRQHDV